LRDKVERMNVLSICFITQREEEKEVHAEKLLTILLNTSFKKRI